MTEPERTTAGTAALAGAAGAATAGRGGADGGAVIHADGGAATRAQGEAANQTHGGHGSAAATPARRTFRFLAHLAEMVVAMVLGMMLLAPVWDWAGGLLGIEAVLARPDVGAAVMVLDMVVAMTAWMRVRRHGWDAVWEMNAAMAAPFAVLLALYWPGVVGAGDLMLWGHVLMVPAMAAVMFLRLPEYTNHVHG